MCPVGGDSATTEGILVFLTLLLFLNHLVLCLPPALPLLLSTYANPLPLLPLFLPGPQCRALGSRPASPQPIRLTRPVLRETSAADIVLKKPVETG